MRDKAESLKPLYRLVYRKTGMDLKPYKEKYLRRRVAVRVRATKQPNLAKYVDYLEQDEHEVEKLILCLTIHVSTFFRNPTTFEAIRDRVLPVLLGDRPAGSLRVWSVGCARGEEPYSLAMLISDYLEDRLASWEVRIDAIDVDMKVLEEAKKARYGESRLREIDPVMVQKYFTRNGTNRLVPAIQEMVNFHRRDVLMAPPESDYDFILCRNLLIYLEREPQERILSGFLGALRHGGYLVLGRTEAMLGPVGSSFEIIDAKERIYRRVGNPEADRHGPPRLENGRTG